MQDASPLTFTHATPEHHNGKLTKKERDTVLIVALATFFVLSIPALIVYLCFKIKALKDSSPKVQNLAQKTTAATAGKDPLAGNRKQSLHTSTGAKPALSESKSGKTEPTKKSTLSESKSGKTEPPKARPLSESKSGETEPPKPSPLPDPIAGEIDLPEKSPLFKSDSIETDLSKKELMSAEEIFTQLIDVIDNIRQGINILTPEEQELIVPVLQELEDAVKLRRSGNKVVELDQKLKKATLIVGVHREMRQKGKVVSPIDFELPALMALGISIKSTSNYHNKDYLYQIVSQMVQNELEETIDGKLQQAVNDAAKEKLTKQFQAITTTITKLAFKIRLKEVGVTEQKQIDKFESILAFCQNIRKSEKLKMESVELQLPPSLPVEKCPDWEKSIKKRFNNQKKNILQGLLKHYVSSKLKDVFNDGSKELDELNRYLDKSQQSKLESQILKIWTTASNCDIDALPKHLQKTFGNIKQRIDFYNRYAPFLDFELIQGANDSNDVLDKGVCHALNRDQQKYSQLHPDKTALEIKQEIGANTRFKQAQYEMGTESNDFETEKKLGAFFRSKGLKNESSLCLSAAQLTESSGWVTIGLRFGSSKVVSQLEGCNSNEEAAQVLLQYPIEKLTREGEGHALSLRMDRDRNKFWLYDPNVGLICFDGQANAEQMVHECLMDLIQAIYPDLIAVFIDQLVAKNT